MKTLASLVTSVVFLIAAILILESCEVYHFENPLPTDASNQYEFPKEFRGAWVVDGDTITIGKNFFEVSSVETAKIFNGVWNRQQDSARHNRKEDEGVLYDHLKEVIFDSLGIAKDTSVRYIFKGKRIYRVTEEGIEKGWPFVIKGDTIYCAQKGTLRIDLNTSFFLRQVSGSFYIVNGREGNVFDGKDQWWRVLLMNRNPDGTVVISDFKNIKNFVGGRDEDWKSKMVSPESVIYALDNDYYYDGKWTKKDVQKLIQDSVFSDHTIKLKETARIRKK